MLQEQSRPRGIWLRKNSSNKTQKKIPTWFEIQSLVCVSAVFVRLIQFDQPKFTSSVIGG